MIEEKPLSKEIVVFLYKLAKSNFMLHQYRREWEAIGCVYTATADDEYGFKVEIKDHWHLTVDPLKNRVLCAFLPVCYWEDWNCEWHASNETFVKERQSFDEVYERTLALTIEAIGLPDKQVIDSLENNYKASIWTTENGVLILQQVCFDPQFGVEVNYWLQCGSIIETASSLINCLTKFSFAHHESEGFPALDWSE